MNKKLLFLISMLITNTHIAQSNWVQAIKQFKITNRDMVFAGSTAAVISAGSYLFYRLSDNYQLSRAQKLIKNHTITYEYLHDEYGSFSESSFDSIDHFLAAIAKMAISSDKALDMISSIQQDCQSLKTNELDADVANALVELLNKCKKLKSKIQAISDYLIAHKGYVILQDYYATIKASSYAELKAVSINAQEVLQLAKTNTMSMNSAYPLYKYGMYIVNLHSKLVHALLEFETTEGKNSSVEFYTNAVLLERNIAEIKRVLIGLEQYATEKTKYDENQKQEALIAAETKRAQAAYDQAQAEKKQVAIAKKQLEESKKLVYVKESLLSQRKTILSKLEDIRRAIGIWNVSGIIAQKLDEINQKLDEIKHKL